MKVFMIYLLTLIASSAVTMPAIDMNLLSMDSNEGWLVPDLNFNVTWIPKSLVLEELDQLRKELFSSKFYLYTRSNPSKDQRLVTGTKHLLAESNFNSSNPTSIIIHGWQNSHQSEICTLVRDALLQREPCNVICVDWNHLSRRMYPTACFILSSVGKDISNFLYFLRSQAGLSFDKVTLIGHSLGAHIAGLAGKNLNPLVHHIIGCDPALPLIGHDNCAYKLCNTDAKFVETIQTCGGRLGIFKPVAAATYYPNGGKSQPGCGIDVVGICAHSRSYIYLAEAIVQDDFPSKRCRYVSDESVADCGPVDTNLRMASRGSYGVNGIFYVPVNNKPNFGTG